MIQYATLCTIRSSRSQKTIYRALAFSLCLFLRFGFYISAAQNNQNVRTLESNSPPIERELAGGQFHVYQIKLEAGQFLHVVVDQRGIDVVVKLFGPDGQKLAEVDSPNGAQGPEPVFVISQVSGSYTLEVRSIEKEAEAGRYEINRNPRSMNTTFSSGHPIDGLRGFCN